MDTYFLKNKINNKLVMIKSNKMLQDLMYISFDNSIYEKKYFYLICTSF